MKTTHIIAIVIIGIAIGIIVSTTGDASKYVTFKEAWAMSQEGDNDKVHVVGRLKKNREGKIVGMHYDPASDPNYFTFTLEDSTKEEHQVVYYHPKPQDMERSEQVVIVGSFHKDVFVADEILLKCPSKYEERQNKESL